jgi:histidine triad (HIT) family protein
MSDCIFCKIVKGEIPSTRIHDDDKVIGFKDLRPQASKHYLFIHRNHTQDITDMVAHDPDEVKDLFRAITHFAKKDGLDKDGFRIVTNQGPFAGQTVFHTHFHLVGGEPLGHFGS